VNDLTNVLSAAQNGDARAAEQLLPLVYGELRKLAAAKLCHERDGQTLQATALVHEAWPRIAGSDENTWNGRGHFFGAAAEAMRRILIERARRKRAVRHGGGLDRIGGQFEDSIATPVANEDEMLAVHEALDRLAVRDPRKVEVVKLRYFVGLSLEETAQALGISEATAKRDWVYARAWLGREIEATGK
jgi:RNA polymerase sigma factor (TIGR02999 family)